MSKLFEARIAAEHKEQALRQQIEERSRLEALSGWHEKNSINAEKHRARNRQRRLNDEVSLATEQLLLERREALRALLGKEQAQYEAELAEMGYEIERR